MKLRMFVVLLGLGLLFGGIFGYKAFVDMKIREAMAQRPEPSQTVSAAVAQADAWQPTIRSVGSLRALQGVEVAPEVGGLIIGVAVESGDEVSAGDVLFRIGDAVDRAELRGLEAEARLAEIELERQRRLRSQGANSQSDVDRAQSELEQAVARADARREQIAKKTVRAPFDGRIGIIDIDVGQFVDPGQALVTLQQLDPIEVDFSVPQQRLAEIARDQVIDVRLDAIPGERFSGHVTAISPKIDERSRNVAVRARIDNPEARLRPGMFVDVRVRLPLEEDVVTVPQSAISYNPYGDFIFVVDSEVDGGEEVLRADQRFVRTGPRRGDQVAVREGVAAGERVVTSGQLKLRDGARLEINNQIQPDSEADPDVGNF